RWCTEIQEADDRVDRAQSQRVLDTLVVRGCTGTPESAEAKRMRRNEDVLCGSTRRDDLLDGRHAAMLAQPRRDDDEQGRAHRLRALLRERRFRQVRIAQAQRT